MFKKIIALILAATMLLACVGCGDGDGGSGSGESIDMASMLEEMKKTDTKMPSMKTVSSKDENAEATFAVLTDFDYEKVEEFIYSYSEEGTPEEIAIIKVKEKSAVGDLMKALQAHVDSRKSTFQAYDPEQASVVENAVVTYKDNYILLAIGSTSGAMQTVFKG